MIAFVTSSLGLPQGGGVLLETVPGLGGAFGHPGGEDRVTNLDRGIERGDREGGLAVLLAEDVCLQ